MTSYGQRRGFTMVELLVVVAIIGILAGLIMVGGSAAFRAARESATRMEMTNLERAIEMYKTKYGEYPPDFSDYDAFGRHFRKRWPRASTVTCFGLSAADLQDPAKALSNTQAIQDAVAGAMGITGLLPLTDPTFDANLKLSAIAFWLGGLPDPADPTTLIGFGPSDNPLCLVAGGAGRDLTIFNNAKLREKPMYDFSATLRNLPDAAQIPTDGYRCLVSGKPVAYFRGTTLTTRAAKNHAYLQQPPAFAPGGYDPTPTGAPPEYTNAVKHIEGFTDANGQLDEVTPYAMKTASSPSATLTGDTIDWHNANSFQLIHPGADGRFSTLSLSTPVPNCRPIAVTDDGQEYLTAEDLDNITNCGSSATIQGIIGK